MDQLLAKNQTLSLVSKYCQPGWCSVAALYKGYLYVSGEDRRCLVQKLQTLTAVLRFQGQVERLARHPRIPRLYEGTKEDPISEEELISIFRRNS